MAADENDPSGEIHLLHAEAGAMENDHVKHHHAGKSHHSVKRHVGSAWWRWPRQWEWRRRWWTPYFWQRVRQGISDKHDRKIGNGHKLVNRDKEGSDG